MKSLPSLIAIPTIAIACLPLTVAAQSVEELIAEGDKYARVFNEEKALKAYGAAAKLDPENATIYVAISKEYRHLMSEAKSKVDKQRHLKTALAYALKAAELAPLDAEAQLAPAITYGKMLSLAKNTSERLELSRNLKVAADKAIGLNARNDTAWYVLGLWHHGVAEVSSVERIVGGIVHGKIPVSTFENAEKCFRKAIEINPKRLMHHVELGQVYYSMGKKAEAKERIKHGLALAETEKDDPETKQRGRETLLVLK